MSLVTRWSLVLLVCLVAVAYWPVLGHEFLRWDDTRNLLNPDFDPPSLSSLQKYWQRPHGDLYIPITYSYWAGVAALGRAQTPDEDGARLNPYLFHAGNILLHLAASSLAFAILLRLYPSIPAALCGALLFALHPVQVESVAWISGAKDVLCGLWCLLAVYLHLLKRQGAPRTGLLQVGIVIAFLLAVLSKPAAVTLPLALLALDLFLLHPPRRRAMVEAILLLVLAAPFVMIGLHAQPASVVGYRPPFYLRPLVAADALAFYAVKIVAPLRLCIDYGRRTDWLVTSWQIYLSWLIPAALLAAAWLLRKRLPAMAAGLALSIAALLPILGLVTFDFQAFSTVADHYLYFPIFGVALLVAGALSKRSARVGMTLAVGLGCVLAARSFAQARTWHNDTTLFDHTLSVNPTSLAGLANRGHIHYDRREYRQAAGYYARALEAFPSDIEVLLANGVVKDYLGQADAGIALMQRAIAINPQRPTSHFYLGNAAIRKQDWELARTALQRAVELRPDYAEAWCNLGVVMLSLENRDEAVRCFRTALQYEPKLPPAQRGLARALAMPQSATRPATQPGR